MKNSVEICDILRFVLQYCGLSFYNSIARRVIPQDSVKLQHQILSFTLRSLSRHQFKETAILKLWSS